MPKRYDIGGVLHELRHRRRRRRPSGPPTLDPAASPLVSVVVVTNRPEQSGHVMETFLAQDWDDKELVIVANCADYPIASNTDAAIRVQLIDAAYSLGHCLNAGFELARGTVIARLDDDDHYAPNYVRSIVQTFTQTDAVVVGKAEYFAHVERFGQVFRLYPGRSNQYVGRIAGGSLAVIKHATKSVRFPDTGLGEDIAYVQRCERAGLRVWASDPQGFLQTRRSTLSHTWQISDEDFVRYATPVGAGADPALWA